MKVARIIATLEPGGAQLSALRLSRGLGAREISTTFLAGDATSAGIALAERYGVQVEAYRIGETPPVVSLQWTPDAAFAEWLAPRLRGADLVHAHMFGAWWAAALAAPASVAVVASEHNEMSWPASDRSEAARAAAPRVALLFAHGPAATRWAAGIGFTGHRLRAGRSAIEGLLAEPMPGLASPRLTFTGRFREDKAPDLLVEALALLPSPPPSYLVGDGPQRASLVALIRARRLEEVVRLPGWSYEPARYVAGATVHVVPSREEASSQSALVALGLGVPVVGTAVDGNLRTLGGGRGLLVRAEDPPALASALARVLTGGRPDPAPGRDFARRFSEEAVAASYADVYAEVLGEAGGPNAADTAPITPTSRA